METTEPASIPFGQYRRALAFVAPYWRGFTLVTLLGLLSTAVALAQPYISRLLIDDALLRHNMSALAKNRWSRTKHGFLR